MSANLFDMSQVFGPSPATSQSGLAQPDLNSPYFAYVNNDSHDAPFTPTETQLLVQQASATTLHPALSQFPMDSDVWAAAIYKSVTGASSGLQRSETPVLGDAARLELLHANEQHKGLTAALDRVSQFDTSTQLSFLSDKTALLQHGASADHFQSLFSIAGSAHNFIATRATESDTVANPAEDI